MKEISANITHQTQSNEVVFKIQKHIILINKKI